MLNKFLNKLDVDYAGVYDLNSLENLPAHEKFNSALVAIAANIGRVRLIDNIILT